MKKRIAYVGLSTPVGYDYNNNASKAPADLTSSPNPLLDSPYGLFLLFDEIWFLTRSLCPENLRNASFVKFLDESNMVPFINREFCEMIKLGIRETESRIYNEKVVEAREEFSGVISRLASGIQYSIDNHTHALQIGDVKLGGNPLLSNLLFDMAVVSKLNNCDIELVTNTFTQSWFESNAPAFKKAELAEVLIIDNIPNYISQDGPYHPSVEEVRENEYLKHFRKWITSRPLHSNRSELLEIKAEVEETIRKAQDEVFLRYLDQKNHYKSVGKSIIGDTLGLIIPGVSTVSSIIEETNKFFNNKDRRWQGFIVSLRK